MSNWNDLANTRVGDVTPPKPIPAGHYVGIIAGLAGREESRKNKTLGLKFPIKLSEPLDDVDREAFEASDGFKDKYDLTFWCSPNALYRFTDFGKAMGASDDLNVLELAEWLATCNEPFIVEVSHQLNEQNPDAPPFVRVDNPAPMSSRG